MASTSKGIVPREFRKAESHPAAAKKSKIKKSDDDFSTSWDVDSYRTDFETEEHWTLRRSFLLAHKDKFPEDRLVCLAQTFINIEFLGCRYPLEVQRQVAELSKDVAKDFRKSRENRLKRTFVTASDAAEARAKVRRTTTTMSKQPPQFIREEQPSCGTASTNLSSISYQSTPGTHQRTHDKQQSHQQFNNTLGPQQSRASDRQRSDNKPTNSDHQNLFDGLRYGKFVLYLSGARNCLMQSAARCGMKIIEREDFGENNTKTISIYLNEQRLVQTSATALKDGKAKAFNDAIALLQKHCFSIKPNAARDTIKVDNCNNEIVFDVIQDQPSLSDDKKLDATNLGYKMMKSMGWTGGGLGAKKQGRTEPVAYLLKNNRRGLGNDHQDNIAASYFKTMLQNYVQSEDIRQMRLESTFTKEQRAMLHDIAGKLSLKSCSYGKGEDRHLVISKKNITNERILIEILLNKNAAYENQYLVQVPEAMAVRFPEHAAQLTLDM